MLNSSKQVKTWNEVLHQHLEANLNNACFTIGDLANLMFVSERQLYRTMKDMFGVTPKEYINHIRFKRAYEYLENNKFKTVNETASAVGFKDTIYFSRQFKARFGLLPKNVLAQDI